MPISRLVCVVFFLLISLLASERADALGTLGVNDAIRMGIPILTMNTYWDDPNAGHHGECQGGTFHGVMGEGGSDWAGPFLLDTTSDWGGCKQQFVIRDPVGGPNVTGLHVYMEFGPNPGVAPGYCDNGGQVRREIPIVAYDAMQYTQPIRINTDARSPGGCFQRFIVDGRPDIGLDIKYYVQAGGDPQQCGNGLPSNRWHTATVGSPVELRLNTDDRPGGCYVAFRLRFLSGPSQATPVTQPLLPMVDNTARVDAANKGVPMFSLVVSKTDVAERDAHQCPPSYVRRAIQTADGSDFIEPFLINTDDGWGGCAMSFLIRDAFGGPSLFGLRIYIEFGAPAGADPGLCMNPGTHEIPIVAYGELDGGGGGFVPIVINTDTAHGKGVGCTFKFLVRGRNDIGLDFMFYPSEGADPQQCQNATGKGIWRTASANHDDGFTVVTDNRPGGCFLSFRLRSLGTTTTPGSLAKPTVASPSAAGGQFIKPQSGAQVHGIVPLEVTASAPGGVANVQIVIDGNTSFCKLENNAPYTCNWNSRKVPNGSHTLTAVIRDKANNAISVQPVMVKVQN